MGWASSFPEIVAVCRAHEAKMNCNTGTSVHFESFFTAIINNIKKQRKQTQN